MSTKKDKFSSKDKSYMKLAINLARARKGLTGENPSVGCVIVKNDKILSIGQTGYNGRPHAETNAINSSFQNLSGSKMYVTLEPCVMCMGAIYWSQLSKIVFGAEDKKRGYQQASLDPHPKALVYGGVMAKEATVLIQRFFQKKRK